ncbi:MAG TPA: response regulator [Rhodopila sp.]|nr:response regulator [Rhodopila sp.]
MRLCHFLSCMSSSAPPTSALAAQSPPAAKAPDRAWPAAAAAGLGAAGAAGIGAASLALWLLTRQPVPPIIVGCAGLAVGGGCAGIMVFRLRTALRLSEARAIDLEVALHRAQKLEAVGRLTTGIAHDFNNHLTAISSNIELVERHLDQVPAPLRRNLDAAMQGVQRAAALCSRLLTFSRQPAAEHESIDVNRLVGGLAELLRRSLDGGASLDIRVSATPWFVWADVNQMENAILSLAVNVRDRATEAGTLTLTVGNARLDDSFAATNPSVLPGEYVRIAIGFADAPPRRTATADASHAELSMAQAFARRNGGCLQVADGLAQMFLPRYVPPSIAPPAPRRHASDRATILLVEDDSPVRTACAASLRTLGFVVLEAPDAMEAFRLIADQGGIDLLFTDLGLPGGVSGRMLAEAARHADPGIRVLFTTGYNEDATPGAALLRKPFDMAGLAKAVRDALAADAVPKPPEAVGSRS